MRNDCDGRGHLPQRPSVPNCDNLTMTTTTHMRAEWLAEFASKTLKESRLILALQIENARRASVGLAVAQLSQDVTDT
jgi:hypothetical protein